MAVLIILIILLILFLIILFIKNKKLETRINQLNAIVEKLNEDYNYTKKELKRYENKIKSYEENDLEIATIKIGDKKIKKNYLYKGKRVLLGEYQKAVSDNATKILKTYGLIVDVVKTGEDIVDKIKHGYKCDIIITNNTYKVGFDGPTTLKELKKIKGFDIPVIVHTVSTKKRHYFIDVCGFDEYLEKPISIEKVKPILEKFFKK